MYIHGGSAVDAGQESFNDLWVFDFTSHKFCEIKLSKRAQSPPAMYGHSLSYMSGSLYLFGGTSGFQYYKAFWKFDLTSSSWSPVVVAAGGPSKVGLI